MFFFFFFLIGGGSDGTPTSSFLTSSLGGGGAYNNIQFKSQKIEYTNFSIVFLSCSSPNFPEKKIRLLGDPFCAERWQLFSHARYYYYFSFYFEREGE
jgi:hypothetical protein